MNKKLLVALGCASLLVCGCDKAEEGRNPVNQVDEQEVEKAGNDVVIDDYRTADGLVVFKNVDTTEEIKNAYKKDLYDQNYSLDNVIEYAYVNNIPFAIMKKNEDDNYAKYSGNFAASVGAQYNIVFLINKKTGEIIELNKNDYCDNYNYNYNEVSGLMCRFSGETNSVDFFKTQVGYFFVRHTMDPDIIYTTTLKELGMVIDYKTIESDSEGIYVYTEFDQGITPVKSSYTKFNVNGDIIK